MESCFFNASGCVDSSVSTTSPATDDPFSCSSNPRRAFSGPLPTLPATGSAATALYTFLQFRSSLLPFSPSSSTPAHENTSKRGMQEKSAAIGLSWAPKVSMPFSGQMGNFIDSRSPPETSLLKTKNELLDGLYVPPMEPKKLNKLAKKSMKATAGKNWFDLPAPVLTSELKKDFEIIKLRGVLDPKLHFKRVDDNKAMRKYFQVGTVIDPAHDYFSRLTKKERKPTLADEVLADTKLRDYRLRKVRQVNESRQPGGVGKWKIKGRATWKRAKERRREG